MNFTRKAKYLAPVAALTLAVAGIAAVSTSPASSAATVNAGPFDFSGCTTAVPLPPGFGQGTISFSGNYPDSVEPGQEFTVTDVVVVIQSDGLEDSGPLHDDQGPVIDFGDWGTVTFPPPTPTADGHGVLDGKQTVNVDEITLTAPDTEGNVPIAIHSFTYKTGTGALPPFDCEGHIDPDEAVITTLAVQTPTTTTTSTTTSTTSTTLAPTPVTTIDGAGVTSQGCDLSVPIHFAETGDYTLSAQTATGRNIGSTQISRDAPGDATAVVTIDGNHGLQQGDEIDLVLTDSSGATVAQTSGTVDNPEACTPETPSTTAPGDNGNTEPLVQNNNASPATPVAAKPSYTG